MYLPSSRYEEIISVIVELFKKNDIRNIPIDCFEIAFKMGIILKPYSMLSEAGVEAAMKESQDGFCLLKKEDIGQFSGYQWYIFYNDSMKSKRIRFTIMHEIGHIALDHTEASDLAEAEANFFAKYALAPPPLVNEVNPEDYIELGNEFDISNQYARYAFSYYEKWLNYGDEYYNTGELELLNQFGMELFT